MEERNKRFEMYLGSEYAKVVEKTQSLQSTDRLDRSEVMLSGLMNAGMVNLAMLGLGPKAETQEKKTGWGTGSLLDLIPA